MNILEFILFLKNSDLSNKDKLKRIIQDSHINYNINNMINVILELFDLQQCDKIECYWYYNKKDINENNCCLSSDMFYDCYKSKFKEHYQKKDIYNNELGINNIENEKN